MRFAILGNSGSGKSTLAKWLGESTGLPVLDLDSVAWEPDEPGEPRPPEVAEAEVVQYCAGQPSWVVEGCYANLIAAALPFQPVLVFLEPGVQQCTSNCLNRPWEPHKYASKEDQDANLQFLLGGRVLHPRRRDVPGSPRGRLRRIRRHEGRVSAGGPAGPSRAAGAGSPRVDPVKGSGCSPDRSGWS